MKYLIILLLLLAFWAYVFWRLRPYIRTARRILGIFRDARQFNVGEPAAPQRPLTSEPSASQRLVRCASCGTWIPLDRAVKLRSQAAVYCSHACLERAASEVDRQRSTG